jgi:molybdopterin molybdotransferase
MLGSESVHRPSVKAKLEKPIASTLGVRSYLRAVLSEDSKSVRALDFQEEMSTLAEANALISVPESVTELSAGDEVIVVVLRRRYF